MSDQVHITVQILRYFELACHLAAIGKEVFDKVCLECIQMVFANYFEYDMLTQIAMLDFMPLFTKLKWTAGLVAPFL